jgi:hypothetical protein
MEIAARDVRFAASPLIACLIAGASAHGGELPAPDPQHYQNFDYQFSVRLPKGFPACVSPATNHGVAIYLDRRVRCNDSNDHVPYIDLDAEYNVGSEVQTPDQRPARTPFRLALIECRERAAGRTEWLPRVRLGGRQAAGCKQFFSNGQVSIFLITLRKTPESADEWIEVSAYLATTADRYRNDIRVFRKVLKTVWIHPDGPQN